jgi:GNAT superfamily N-acetyltransferase
MVGAATGMPLRYENDGLIAPFKGSSYSVDELFYVGELLFYPEYRGCGLGIRLLMQIEEYVRSLDYRYLTCATVVRPDHHALCPESYIKIDRFLVRTGFIMFPDVTTIFAWKETDERVQGYWVNKKTFDITFASSFDE